MRQLPTPSTFARAAFATLVTAAFVAAQSPDLGGPDRRDVDHRPTGNRVDADTGEVLSRWSAPSVDLTSWPAAAGRASTTEAAAGESLAVRQDEPDDGYSVTGMFNELHGEFLQKGFAFRNNLRLSYGYQSKAGAAGVGGKFQFDDIRGEAFVPMTVDPDMLVILGARVGRRGYQFDSSAPGAADEDVWETAFHVGVGRFMTEDLYIEAVFRPGLYSDFDGTITGDDWRFYGDAIATYRFDPGFYGKVGVIYDGTFNDVPVFPAVGFALLLDETFRLDMLLPKNIELSWIPNATWILKGGLALDGEEYHVRTPLGPGGKQGYDVRTQELRLYVDGTMRMNDSLSVFGRFGSTLTGDYAWGGFDAAVDPSLFFDLGVGINF